MNEPTDQARFEAGLVYTTHPEGISVPELRSDPTFAHISEKTLYRWCKEDQWVERRKAVFEKFRKRAEDALASMLARARIAEVGELLEVKEIMLEWIRTREAAPKSLEGMVKALLDLNVRREGLAVSIATEALPGLDRHENHIPAIGIDETSVEELKLLVKQRLKARREDVREQFGIETKHRPQLQEGEEHGEPGAQVDI